MGKQTPIRKEFEMAGRTYVIETGKLADLADGSVMIRTGNTMMLATICADKKAKEGQSFFPLTVEYREKFSSAGRIPGNFFRRETRPSDYEVLISRLIDRACRPLFPDNYMCDTQLFVTLYSAEPDVAPDMLAAFAASCALSVSDVPFDGPISEVRVVKLNGEYLVNPTKEQQKAADLDVIVAATMRDILMVEGEASECQEEELVEAIKIAHTHIKIMCQAQIELREICGKAKRAVDVLEEDLELKEEIKTLAKKKIYDIASAGSSKSERKEAFAKVDEETKAALLEKHGEESMAGKTAIVGRYLSKLNKETIREMMIADKKRLDGRKLDEIRPIWSEVDYLPSTHGSAIFSRGETQALASVTLGTKLDEAMNDQALALTFDRFLLHYNFPPFCTGEVKPSRGTSRREVGHGNLARRSLEMMMPENYPYTVRIISDVLESNGSSSMATVCAGSLALFDAGVPLGKAVSGIAMGLIADEKGNTAILSDILGDEDHLGDMDFKVTGTEKGICGCQMDIKIDGMPYELLIAALEQAKRGRLHILGQMNSTLNAPNEDLKPHAPRMVNLEVDSEYIGKIIGPGGKNIQGLQKETNTVITIEEVNNKGIVTISSANKENLDRAYNHIKIMTTEPEVGSVYEHAKVIKLMPFGAFVEFMPGKEGLVHVSEMKWERVNDPADVVSEGDIIAVKYVGIDEKNGKMRLSMRALTDKPEGFVEREREARPPRDNNGFGRDNRGGGGGGGGFNRNRR